MSVRNQLRLLAGGIGAHRRAPSSTRSAALREFFDRNQLVGFLIFIVTVAAIVFISSAGMTTINLPVLPGQVATVRVAARAPFSYVSEEKTRAGREELINRVPPVYRLEQEPFRRFETAARGLLPQLAAFEAAHPANAPGFTNRTEALAALADEFNSSGTYRVDPEDLNTLLSAGDAAARAAIFENGLAALHEIYLEGVHDASFDDGGAGDVTVFQIARPGGDIAPRPVQSMEEALTFLRVSVGSGEVPQPVAQALFRFFRNGVTANLVFDRAATAKRLAEARQAFKPVTVNVANGQEIISAGDRVSPEQYEMLMAYERLGAQGGDRMVDGLILFGHVLLVLAMVLASVLYIRLEDPETLRSNGRLGLLALVVIVNLALVRTVYSLGGAEFFMRDGSWASTLPYVAPTALAPLIVAILIDAGSAIFMALLISIFTGVIYGNRLDLLVLTFLASLVAIFFCRDARRRSRVVRAAGMGGLTVAAFAALIGVANQTPVHTLAWEMGAGLCSGLLTGIAVVGLLPVLESVFKRTTDITLLELTDYNHPLLRRMQLAAPGTYHHSIVVAQLSENAANAIGANPLQARVCALFHDIGKTVNPAYFTENQRNRVNPHDKKDPAASARIIREHVTEGVDLGLKHHLPRAVIDVIRQHHGTTLVRYFYDRAVAAAGGDAAAVAEADFRYDGPRPQFRESAVISLADGVEAATRSLRSASAGQLGRLIDGIVGDRIAAGQLNEAPLTLEDIAKVKNSFVFTLLNMLHGRVAYGDAESAGGAEEETQGPSTGSGRPPAGSGQSSAGQRKTEG